jgi:hypothetical protein
MTGCSPQTDPARADTCNLADDTHPAPRRTIFTQSEATDHDDMSPVEASGWTYQTAACGLEPLSRDLARTQRAPTRQPTGTRRLEIFKRCMDSRQSRDRLKQHMQALYRRQHGAGSHGIQLTVTDALVLRYKAAADPSEWTVQKVGGWMNASIHHIAPMPTIPRVRDACVHCSARSMQGPGINA